MWVAIDQPISPGAAPDQDHQLCAGRDNMWDEPEHVAVRITQVADAADAVHVFERQRRGTAQLQTFWYTSSMSPSTPTTTLHPFTGAPRSGAGPCRWSKSRSVCSAHPEDRTEQQVLEANKDAVRRYFDERWNKRNYSIVDELDATGGDPEEIT